MNGNSRRGSAARAATMLALFVTAPAVLAEGPALTLRAAAIGAASAPFTVELFRWSTDAERAPLLAALSAPPPAPPAPPAAAGGRAGRGGRGGRAAAPPPTPTERLTAAIKAAPTFGFIWGDGPTGYSIKYAWRAASPTGDERIVLVTDRRLGAQESSWPRGSGPAAEADFTVMELRLNGKGVGEGKASVTSPVVVDAAAGTLAIDAWTTAPAVLKVTR